MHQEILDQKRQSALPQIARAGAGFYLAGGTALALQFGHRDSIDFDFFCPESFDTRALHTRLTTIFSDVPVSKMQDETNTLTVLIDDEVQLSFFCV